MVDCYKVYVGDQLEWLNPHEEFERIFQWAKSNMNSVQSFNVMDVTDVSLVNDYIAEYRFEDNHEAEVFESRWKAVTDGKLALDKRAKHLGFRSRIEMYKAVNAISRSLDEEDYMSLTEDEMDKLLRKQAQIYAG